MLKEIAYNGRKITLDTEQFGNGWAVSVRVDGEGVLDKYDTGAVHETEERALEVGADIGKRAVDGVLNQG